MASRSSVRDRKGSATCRHIKGVARYSNAVRYRLSAWDPLMNACLRGGRMDVYDEAVLNMTTLEIDAPGMPKDYVNVSVFEGNLTISFEAPFGVDTGSPRFYRQRERQYGQLTRVMKLPAGTKVRRPADLLRVALVHTLTLFWPCSLGTSAQAWTAEY